ncbi:MAG: hypothetical protein ABSC50_03200 [Candidatus Bathyarchaeia archaeon]
MTKSKNKPWPPKPRKTRRMRKTRSAHKPPPWTVTHAPKKAGRLPTKRPLMATKAATRDRRPVAGTRSAGGTPIGDFSALERMPGVTVSEKSVSFPYPGTPSGVRIAVHASSRRVAEAAAMQLSNLPLSHQLSAAKSRYYLGMTQTIFEAYKGMEKHYRAYRMDAIVRGCINALAYWSTKESFDTVLEPVGEGLTPEQQQQAIDANLPLKQWIDKINLRVDLDHVLRVAIIKAKIYGKAGFEIELNQKKEPGRLISLPLLSLFDLRPNVNEDWELEGFWWRGQKNFYAPGELLYFTNNSLESDYEGISDIEPVLDDVETRAKIRIEDLKEAATTLWAGIAIHSLDVDRLPAGLTDADVQAIIDTHIASLRPGKHIATDNRWAIQVIDLKPDLQSLVAVKNDLDQEIIGNFQVPKFILNRTEQVNRATSYTQLESFVDGPITDIQRWIQRVVEQQWYDPLTRLYLKTPNGQDPPVRVRHRWREIRTTDFFQLLTAVAAAYDGGLGMVDKEKAYELMRDGASAKFDPAELAETEQTEPTGQ